MHTKLLLANSSIRSTSLVEKKEMKNKYHCYEVKSVAMAIQHYRRDACLFHRKFPKLERVCVRVIQF